MSNHDSDETRYLGRPRQYFPPEQPTPPQQHYDPGYRADYRYRQELPPLAAQPPEKPGPSTLAWIALIVGAIIAAALFFLLGRMTASPTTERVETTVTQTATVTQTTTITPQPEEKQDGNGFLGDLPVPSDLQDPDLDSWLRGLLGDEGTSEPSEATSGVGA